jgi:hypothetical protein
MSPSETDKSGVGDVLRGNHTRYGLNPCKGQNRILIQESPNDHLVKVH